MAKLPPKTIPNPEFLASEEVRDQIEEIITQQHMGLGLLMQNTERPFSLLDGMNREIWSALPERGGCEIPENGAWIIIKEVPHTEVEDRFEVPVLSLWRARPTYRNREFRLGGKGKGRRVKVNWPMLMAIVNTPGGELWLYPGEYITTDIEAWLPFLGRELQVHFLGAGEPGDLADQVFYIQSHGVPRRDAMLLVLPNLLDQNFCWFSLHLDQPPHTKGKVKKDVMGT